MLSDSDETPKAVKKRTRWGGVVMWQMFQFIIRGPRIESLRSLCIRRQAGHVRWISIVLSGVMLLLLASWKDETALAEPSSSQRTLYNQCQLSWAGATHTHRCVLTQSLRTRELFTMGAKGRSVVGQETICVSEVRVFISSKEWGPDVIDFVFEQRDSSKFFKEVGELEYGRAASGTRYTGSREDREAAGRVVCDLDRLKMWASTPPWN